MSAMENRDEVLQMLERFTRLKQKEIPRELEDYLNFVARTGDTVYPWPAVKYFFRTKLSLVIMDFHDNTPSIADLPQCPNVDPFCYDRMRRTLLSRMDSFNSAPFTIQRICELLNEPRKHYTRIDKFMRAVEKNILVVSTQEPGRRRSDSENGDSLDSIVNGDLEVNVDIEMDNEAFGIDSNEMVPTAAATDAAVIPPVTTTTRAVDVPVMESSEEQEQETETHEPETVPEVALTDNGVHVGEVNDAKPEETVPKEVEENDKNASEPVEEASDQTDKVPYSGEVEPPTSPEACALDSKEEQHSNMVDSVGTDALDHKEQSEAPAQESHDTGKSTAAENPPTTALETDNDSLDDGEPKAKIAKLSQEDPERETEDPKPTAVSAVESPAELDKDTVSSESTTDSNGSSVEYVDCNISSEEPEEPAETGVVLPSSSDASTAIISDDNISSNEPSGSEGYILSVSDTSTAIISDVDISSNDPSGSDGHIVPSVSDTTSSESGSVSTMVNPVTNVELESNEAQPEQPTAQPTSEAASASEAAATAETVAIAEENEETIVKRINLEANPSSLSESEPPTVSRVNSDEMETVVAESVMATDEEEQPPTSAVVEPVVPMAADASDTAKPDENAMDIDESSVEPMDQ